MRLATLFAASLITISLDAAGQRPADSADAFRAALLAALTANDVAAVRALIAFPLRVNLPGAQSLTLPNAGSLTTESYTAVFTPETICAIERGPVTDTGETVTIGKDVVVARRTGGSLKVAQVRVTGAPADTSGGVRSSFDLRFRGATRQVAGNLSGNQVDSYVVSLTSGLVLQGRLERFQGQAAVLRVTDSKGQPVNAKADGRRTWSSAVRASGDYRVDVVRRASACDPPLTYLLTLTAR